MSVDDMLWWLYDTYKIVVGTRTIRRVFERKGDKVKVAKGSTSSRPSLQEDEGMMPEHDDPSPVQTVQYQSPYEPMHAAQSAEQQFAQALQQQTPQAPPPYPALATADLNDEVEDDTPDDEETLQLQLEQIALQKREVELKLRMRRLQQTKGTPSTRKMNSPPAQPSVLFNPEAAAQPPPPKRDSRSKKKIEESKRRTAERQERMLRELERRSRRRDHLTAEWVQSKDIWPLRAQGLLADLMHQYACYAFSPTNESTFDAMYRDLYQLVDITTGDWVPPIHDELLRERMKRKMGQLRTKMQKTGEIIGRNDAYGGWQKAEDYTGEAAGAAIGDDSEIQPDLQQASGGGAPQMQPDDHHLHQQHQHAQHQHEPPHPHPNDQPLSYDLASPSPHHHQHQHHPHTQHHSQHPHLHAHTLQHQQHQHQQQQQIPYAPTPQMLQPPPNQYPLIPQPPSHHHHPALLPYHLDGSPQQQQQQHQHSQQHQQTHAHGGLGSEGGMVL